MDRNGRLHKPTDPFYLTSQWRAIRRRVLRRDNYRCVMCGADVSAVGTARIDHIKPRSTHPHLALDINNLRALCAKRCDNRRHREKGWTEPTGCDADGWPLRRTHGGRVKNPA
jgi:5-methylcytosine-specific restriction protein A